VVGVDGGTPEFVVPAVCREREAVGFRQLQSAERAGERRDPGDQQERRDDHCRLEGETQRGQRERHERQERYRRAERETDPLDPADATGL